MAETTTATPATKTTAKKTTARKTTAKTTARKAPASKTTRKTTVTTTARKSPAKKTATRKPAAPKTPSLRDRELKVILEDAGYATAGIVGDVVGYATALPGRVERLRDDAEHLAEETPERFKALRDVPEMAEQTLTDLRKRLAKDTKRYMKRFEKRFDAKAKEGRELTDDVLNQAGNARSHLKGAFTSVTRTAEVAVETAHKQAGNVTTQAKATVTTARKGVDQTVAKAKGTVTAAKGAAEETARATGEQADNVKQQTRAAATSVGKTADVIADGNG